MKAGRKTLKDLYIFLILLILTKSQTQNGPFKPGCIETRNITILLYGYTRTELMVQNFRFYHRNLVENNPCYTIHMYLNHRQRAIHLKGDAQSYNLIETEPSVKSNEHIIQDFRLNGPKATPSSKQTWLYIARTSHNQTDNYHQLELLQNEKHWDVLVACNPSICPTRDWIATNRVLPYGTSIQSQRDTLDLLKDPDFNKFDYATPFGNEKCNPTFSKWKVINIIVYNFHSKYLSLALSSGLLTRQHKIVFYIVDDEASQLFWQHYLKAHHLDNNINIVTFSFSDIFNIKEKRDIVIPPNFQKVKNDIYAVIGDFSSEVELNWICREDIMPRFPNLIVYHNAITDRKPKDYCFMVNIKNLEYEDDIFEQIKQDRPNLCR